MADWSESQAIAAKEFLDTEFGKLLDIEEELATRSWKESLDPVVRENAWNYVSAIIRFRNKLKSIANSTVVEQLNNLNVIE